MNLTIELIFIYTELQIRNFDELGNTHWFFCYLGIVIFQLGNQEKSKL